MKCEACHMGYGIELNKCHGYNHANAIIKSIENLHQPIMGEYEFCIACLQRYPCPTINLTKGKQEIDKDRQIAIFQQKDTERG